MSATGDGQGDAGVAQVVKSTGDFGGSESRLEVVLPEARRDDRVAGLVREHQRVGPGLAEALDVISEDLSSRNGDRDRPNAGGRLRLLAEPLPRLEPDELLCHPHLLPLEVDPCTAQPHQLAAAHPGIDGQVDLRLVSIHHGLGQVDGLLLREEGHLAARDARRLDTITRVDRELLLLDRHLQHAAQGPVVAMDRRGREPGGELPPVLRTLSLRRRWSSREGRSYWLSRPDSRVRKSCRAM